MWDASGKSISKCIFLEHLLEEKRVTRKKEMFSAIREGRRNCRERRIWDVTRISKGGKGMRLLLQDGKTEWKNVNRVDERIDLEGGVPTKTVVVQIDVAEPDSITGDQAVQYYQTVGMDCFSTLDEKGNRLKTYEDFPILSSIYTTYTEKTRYLNLVFRGKA